MERARRWRGVNEDEHCVSPRGFGFDARSSRDFSIQLVEIVHFYYQLNILNVVFSSSKNRVNGYHDCVIHIYPWLWVIAKWTVIRSHHFTEVNKWLSEKLKETASNLSWVVSSCVKERNVLGRKCIFLECTRSWDGKIIGCRIVPEVMPAVIKTHHDHEIVRLLRRFISIVLTTILLERTKSRRNRRNIWNKLREENIFKDL